MRLGILVGLAAAALAGIGARAAQIHMPAFHYVPIAERSNGRTSHARYARIQRHTGAGGAGAHKRWKARRASGRL